MTKLMYRGVAHETGAKPRQSLAEQMKRPSLVYRGVEHDGERAIESTEARSVPMFYRGQSYA
ncbi:MAG: DUF4278 domain-containing protein [Pseudomonadota bacterium]